MNAIRTVFFGTPAYAVPALEALTGDDRFDVTLVVTQPDRPAGRGHGMQPPAVKVAASAIGLPVYQPASLRSPDDRMPLLTQAADVFVVAAYGLIFGPKTLAIPTHGCVNLHASLLPKYRGASPVSAAILSGDAETGVSLMHMDIGMDTGDVIAEIQVPIDNDDTTGSLTTKLGDAAAMLASQEIPHWVAGEITGRPQPSDGASLVRPLSKADGWIDWTKPAAVIERHVRAMQPWPRAWTTTEAGSVLYVQTARTVGESARPGEVLPSSKRLIAGCGDGALELVSVQLAGTSVMPGASALNGRKVTPGELLGRTGQPHVPDPMIRPAG